MTSFEQIALAANAGAFGNNDLPEPTPAQLVSGKYPKGRADFHGLSIAIETPRLATRKWKAEDGTSGENLMKFHYGYFEGTKGADGDELDCYVGPWPEAHRVYVINQRMRGAFDEHKVMLGFPDVDSAVNGYLSNYSAGWQGMSSVVACTVTQLKWWIANGDLSRPLTEDQLPTEGRKMEKVLWDSAHHPVGASLDSVLYKIRAHDGKDGLVFDSLSMADVLADADGVLELDALVVPYVRLQSRMELLRKVLDRVAEGVTIAAMQVSEPFTQRGTTNVAVIYELTDGQTVSVFFHNPDTTPKRILPGDDVISWKWMLNKKDITVAVAPERGRDLDIRTVAARIMRLAGKNTARFAAANTRRAERMQAIEELKTTIIAKEGELAELQAAIMAHGEAAYTEVSPPAEPITEPTGDPVATAAPAPVPVPEDVIAAVEEVAAAVAIEAQADVETTPVEAEPAAELEAAPVFDPTTPDGYALVMADPEQQLQWQDRLDPLFLTRVAEVRDALSLLGWSGESGADPEKGEFTAKCDFVHVGGGRNVVGFSVEVVDAGGASRGLIRDDLTQSTADIAARIDALSGPITAADEAPATTPPAATLTIEEKIATAAALGALSYSKDGSVAPAENAELMALLAGNAVGEGAPVLDAYLAAQQKARSAAAWAAAEAAPATLEPVPEAVAVDPAPAIEAAAAVVAVEPAAATWRDKFDIQENLDKGEWRVMSKESQSAISMAYLSPFEAESAAEAYLSTGEFPEPDETALALRVEAESNAFEVGESAYRNDAERLAPAEMPAYLRAAWTDGWDAAYALALVVPPADAVADPVELVEIAPTPGGAPDTDTAGAPAVEALPVESQPVEAASIEPPPVELAPVVIDQPLADAQSYLQSVIEGSADLSDQGVTSKLESIHTAYKDDAGMLARFKAAVNAYTAYAISRATAALAQ